MIFDKEFVIELSNNFKTNRSRVLLTGLSISWGVFMFIILLGTGNGLENGVKKYFKDIATNSVWLTFGNTSLSCKGFEKGRRLYFSHEDYINIRDYCEIDNISGKLFLDNIYATTCKGSSGVFQITPVHPAYAVFDNLTLNDGRFINDLDIKENRMIVTIGMVVKEALFKDKQAVGKYVEINSMLFKIVGVYSDAGGDQAMSQIYMPFTTAQKIFIEQKGIDQIVFTIKNSFSESSEKVVESIKLYLFNKYSFDPKDTKALVVWNTFELYKTYSNMIGNIKLFIWIIGIGTIFSGAMGISNIMLLIVKNRTREIGIKRAIGATPNSLIFTILFESILLTFVFGIFGLSLAVIVLELVTPLFQGPDLYFLNPEISMYSSMLAVITLMIIGTIAGFIPANRAVKIKPVQAMNN